MNNDPSKPIKNSLFNPNVTGNTYEDFAQHAVIFPAQQPVRQSTPTPAPEQPTPQIGNYTIEPNYSNQTFGEIPIQSPVTSDSPSQYFIDQDYSQSFYQPEQNNSSNISSFISTLSNIWTRGSPVQQPPQEQIPPPQQQPDPFYQPYQSPPVPQPAEPLPPVSLYSPTEIPKNTIATAPPQTGPSNTYRRTGPKRAVYAQIPGLSSGAEVTLPTNPSPSVNQTSSPGNYFTPIPPTSSSPIIFPETLRPSASLTPKAYPEYSRPASSITPKPLLETKPSETNSPFLSPVQDLPIFPTVEPSFPAPSVPTMPINEVTTSSASNLPYAYRQDNFLPNAASEVNNSVYRPVYHHWFHKKQTEGRAVWDPFSMHDSQNLETAFTSPDLSPDTVVATDGGRFDVNILRRERLSVYWKSEPAEVKRCSWFHKGSSDGKYVPFDENVATKLEDEFKMAFESNQWHRKVELSTGETVIFHGVDVLMLFPATQSPGDAWGNTPQSQPRPRVVKRGMDEFDIDEGESETVDHLLFMVHGIGAACDLKFRAVEEVVDEFRSIALQLVRSHYRSSCDRKLVNRVEILPISWHEKLHSEDTGIDQKLKSITLESIPKLREFTNDTLLDILFYSSPMYGQTIISSVGNELNSIYELFKQRNPGYNGGVSLGGHSLGSLILFDVLCHQNPPSSPEKIPENPLNSDEDAVSPLVEKPHPMQRRMSRRISYMMGAVGTGQPEIFYPQLSFQPLTFFALGSPIGMFVTVRGLDNLGDQFVLPTCPGFFNIFHPYDPVAYRIESLVNPELATLKPVLIPHHKGRKRMHLELKETMTRVGADLKQKLIDSMKGTWNSLFQMGWSKPQMQPNLEAEVDKVLQEGFTKNQSIPEESTEQVVNEKTDLCLGLLNKGRRVDYVLQEAPVEFFNEYIFTLSSHLCYWESEDTILMILKEIYSTLNVTPDNQIPQQTMTIERPPSSPMSAHNQMQHSVRMGVDPTLPINKSSSVGPPPVSGFVRKS